MPQNLEAVEAWRQGRIHGSDRELRRQRLELDVKVRQARLKALEQEEARREGRLVDRHAIEQNVIAPIIRAQRVGLVMGDAELDRAIEWWRSQVDDRPPVDGEDD